MQLRERLVHRLAGPLGRGSVGQVPRLRRVDHELLVADREGAGTKRADERDAVGGVVDRREHPDEVADLVALEEVASALMPVGDPEPVRGLLVELEAGAGGQQDRHVTPATRTPVIPRRGGRGLPAVVTRGVQNRGDHARPSLRTPSASATRRPRPR